MGKCQTREILLALHETPGVGWKTIHKLIKLIPEFSIEKEYDPREIHAAVQLINLSKEQKKLIEQTMESNDWGNKPAEYQQRGIGYMSIWDELYPTYLKEIADPPWFLYYIGDISLLNNPKLSVVGTRNPTSYGRHVAATFATELSQSGMTIVSGMARGIDSDAHRGALQGIGSSIAVLGTGVDIIYPRENVKLYEAIVEQGLMMSEFPPGTKPHPGLFPLRNRIIAGLSLGTIVVEAAERSGSLITADLALQYSREVFAVPGPVHSPKSAGTNSLIQQGAKLVTKSDDIRDEFRNLINFQPKHHNIKERQKKLLSEDERIMKKILEKQSYTLDQLLEISQFEFGHLQSVLLSLQIKKEIEQLPGAVFRSI